MRNSSILVKKHKKALMSFSNSPEFLLFCCSSHLNTVLSLFSSICVQGYILYILTFDGIFISDSSTFQNVYFQAHLVGQLETYRK